MDDSGTLDELVAAAQRGDDGARVDLLTLIRPTVLKRCAKVLPNAYDAEEAAQDALLAIATKLESYDGRGAFMAWVGMVSLNAARSTYRRLRQTAALPEDFELGSADPRTTSVIAGTRIDLVEAINALEERHPTWAQAFVARDIGALSYAEIADLVGVPVGTIKDRIHQARQFVRLRLQDTSFVG